MTTAAPKDWVAANQARLTEALDNLKALLRRHADLIRLHPKGDNDPPHPRKATQPCDSSHESAPESRRFLADDQSLSDEAPAALDALQAAFGLSAFERNLLLLCAGMELDSAFAPLCAVAQDDAHRNFPTFGLALTAFPDAHWSALAPDAPLRRWRLIEVGSGPALTLSPLRIDERVLHCLAGIACMDEHLSTMVDPVAPAVATGLAASHATVARSIVAAWSAPPAGQELPAVQLCSVVPLDCRPLAAAIATAIGLKAVALYWDVIPASASELDTFLRLWEREVVLGRVLILLECDPDATGAADDAKTRNLNRFIERLAGPVIFAGREQRQIPHRSTITFHINLPTTSEQRTAWQAALASAAGAASFEIDALASQFSLPIPTIRSVGAEVLARAAASSNVDVTPIAWQCCRTRCRTRLDGLAQRIDPAAYWEDLVLPAPQMQALRQVALQVRHRATVYETWGFAAKSSHGLGIAALFAGVSGTGKTMAAEVLANDLRLDLYRIDLASVVSKYIGETEKNLRRVFDAAEESGSILLFDEADALFGKRSEVKDSHDRYANIEVSYLLQRTEAYRGLAILTTNLKSALDAAFFRRLRFVVQFPFPDPPQRAEIWRRILPKATPIEGLDYAKLSKLNVPGGNIRNIAMNAAFLAANDGRCVRMAHLLAAARAEYGKLERPLTDAEIGGWI
jgi:ATPase family associated with various cellular activities (AAA)